MRPCTWSGTAWTSSRRAKQWSTILGSPAHRSARASMMRSLAWPASSASPLLAKCQVNADVDLVYPALVPAPEAYLMPAGDAEVPLEGYCDMAPDTPAVADLPLM